MSGSVNKVILIGNLGRDPEVRNFQNGGKVCNLRIATSQTWKDRNTGELREKTEPKSCCRALAQKSPCSIAEVAKAPADPVMLAMGAMTPVVVPMAAVGPAVAGAPTWTTKFHFDPTKAETGELICIEQHSSQ